MAEARKYRYFGDLRHGAFIFVVRAEDADNWPPEGYDVVEMSEDEVREYLEGDKENEAS